MKQIFLISIIIIIGMCVQNGYYYESNEDWNINSQSKISFFKWTDFNKHHTQTVITQREQTTEKK